MKKYFLKHKIRDERIKKDDGTTSKVSGELLPNIDNLPDEYNRLAEVAKKFPQFGNAYPFNKNRDPFSPFPEDTIFSPLMTIEHTPSPKSKKARYLQDYFSWSKNSPMGQSRVVSKKMKNILEEFNLQKHRFYTAELMHKNKIVKDYFVFQLLENLSYEILDFENTIFEKIVFGKFLLSKEVEEKQFSSREDFKNYSEKNPAHYKIKKWGVNNLFWELDFFFIENIGMVINEQLAERLSNENLFGIEIKEVDFEFS